MASVTTSSLHLYSLTIQPPSAVQHAVVGNFAGGFAADQLLLTATGSRLTLYKIEEYLDYDRMKGRLVEIHSQDVFAIVRNLGTYRIAGSPKEYLIVSADTGRIATLEWQPEQHQWQRNHLETFGQSGIRRAVPGQYLAVDPRGRACMMAAVEKNKIIYFLNRDSTGNLTISSPLEAHKPRTLTFALTALDTGYDNPLFATLELDYTECDDDPTDVAKNEVEKELVYYELDLGLNHVTRKWSEPVDRTAHALYHVPGGKDGPGGVLVCGLDNITYRHNNQTVFRVAIPRRKGATEDPDRKRRIVAGVTPKAKDQFFAILQTDDGDLFKVSLIIGKEDGISTGVVQELIIQYFATIPVASVILLHKTAYLYCASESGSQSLYALMDLGKNSEAFSSNFFPEDATATYDPIYFEVPSEQENLQLHETIDKGNPTTASKVAQLTYGEPPHIVTTCGTGARSSLKITKHGLDTKERSRGDLAGAEGVPTGVWTTKLKHDDEFDSWVVMAYQNSTLTLQIDAESESIEEVSSDDARFLDRVETKAVQLLANNDLVQMHSRGVRVIKPQTHCDDWEAPSVRTVVATASNARQIAVALSSGEIYYFELEGERLAEFEDSRPEMPSKVTSMSFGELQEGSMRNNFLAVGCADQTVRVLTCDPQFCLEQLSIQATSAPPTALQILSMEDGSGRKTLFLHIGLQSGVYIRTVIDEQTGKLSNSQTRFLGPKPVTFSVITVAGQEVLLALSARTWIIYPDPQKKTLKVTPLNYSPLDHASRLNMENDTDGIVGLQGATLCLLGVPSLASHLTTTSTPLQYTPRGLAQIADTPHYIVLESDKDTLSPSAQKIMEEQAHQSNGVKGEIKEDGDSDTDMDGQPDGDTSNTDRSTMTNPRADNHWASYISVVDPLKQKILARLELGENEAAFACCFAPIDSQDGDVFLFVATAQNLSFMPRQASAGYIHLYRVVDQGYFNPDFQQVAGPEFEFLHKTKFDTPPSALMPFQGRLLVGVGRALCIYDVGMKQLLRKSWKPKAAPTTIVGLDAQGNRIIIADQKESITYVMYDRAQNDLVVFADDIVSRWSTCSTMVDYDTVASGDKFGNLFVLRCPKDLSDEMDQEGGALVIRHSKPFLQGAPNKLDLAAHFFLNDIPTSIHKAQLQPGGSDVLVWTGLQGTIGVVIAFAMQDDVTFFMELERCMRVAEPNILGRDHLIFRSYYVPQKCCVDGDLVERFFLLSDEWKQKVSNEVEKSVPEIEKKILDMRARSAY